MTFERLYVLGFLVIGCLVQPTARRISSCPRSNFNLALLSPPGVPRKVPAAFPDRDPYYATGKTDLESEEKNLKKEEEKETV